MSWKRMLDRSRALEASERSIAASMVRYGLKEGVLVKMGSDCGHVVQLVFVSEHRQEG
jgi:hypothetical protein